MRRRPGWLRRSLRASMFEGMLAEVVAACAGGALIIGWAIELRCSALLMAFFGAMPFLSQLVHLPSAWFSKSPRRRQLTRVTLTASRQLLLGLAALPWLPLSLPSKRLLFVGIAGLSSVLGVIGNNAWLSWMGDLVPRRLRANYFSRRAAWSTLAGALGVLGTGIVLDIARRAGHGAVALGLLSVLAWLAGLVCSLLIRRQVDPARIDPPRKKPLQAIGQPWTCRRARPVLAYQLLWNAAIGLGASFFGLFLLRDLRAGFTFLAFHGALLAVSRAIATPVWGRALNRVGARPVLIATTFGIALLPLLLLLPHRHAFAGPLALEAAMGGILWAGHGQASFQLPFAISCRESRPFYSAAFMSTGGVAFAVAALAGGVLLPMLPHHFRLFGAHLGPLHALFLLSMFMRLAAWVVSLRVHEPEAAPVPELWRGLRWWPRWLRLTREHSAA